MVLPNFWQPMANTAELGFVRLEQASFAWCNPVRQLLVYTSRVRAPGSRLYTTGVV